MQTLQPVTLSQQCLTVLPQRSTCCGGVWDHMTRALERALGASAASIDVWKRQPQPNLSPACQLLCLLNCCLCSTSSAARQPLPAAGAMFAAPNSNTALSAAAHPHWMHAALLACTRVVSVCSPVQACFTLLQVTQAVLAFAPSQQPCSSLRCAGSCNHEMCNPRGQPSTSPSELTQHTPSLTLPGR